MRKSWIYPLLFICLTSLVFALKVISPYPIQGNTGSGSGSSGFVNWNETDVIFNQINITENLALIGNITLGTLSTGGMISDGDYNSIDWSNRQLIAEDGSDVILDYFTVGVANFGDSVIRTTNNIEANYFKGDGSQLQNVNASVTGSEPLWAANESLMVPYNNANNTININTQNITGGSENTIIFFSGDSFIIMG